LALAALALVLFGAYDSYPFIFKSSQRSSLILPSNFKQVLFSSNFKQGVVFTKRFHCIYPRPVFMDKYF